MVLCIGYPAGLDGVCMCPLSHALWLYHPEPFPTTDVLAPSLEGNPCYSQADPVCVAKRAKHKPRSTAQTIHFLHR